MPGFVLGQGIQVTHRDLSPPAVLCLSYKLAFWVHKSSVAKDPISTSILLTELGSGLGPGHVGNEHWIWSLSGLGFIPGSTTKQLCELGYLS